MRLYDIKKSSQIVAIGYEPSSQILVVVFARRGDVSPIYQYNNVTADEVVEILFAVSVGTKFNELIKSRPQAHPYALLRTTREQFENELREPKQNAS